MKKMEFEFYKRPNGKVEFMEFLEKIPYKDRIKLLATINNVQEYGINIAIKEQWVKKLDKNLYELRSKVSNNIQRAIYFHYEKNSYVITHGFTKKTQKTPLKELRRGITLRNEYLKGKDN
ncbi:type II toxin-antitoxin system RelE/ParE family toxin [Companilactobacillus mindensis]|nr:type II toxin-antitoxin system RelE/ParE family toxin [Companilactobacillus mindensis]GEO78027.1 hypothetical protein LMI01_03580 [Companilactobacillus mindensis]